MKNLITLVVSVFAVVFVSSMAYSADMSIDMLNKLGKEKMVYSVDVAEIATKGHNVHFIAGPDGWDLPKKSKNNKEVAITFDTPGIYLYQCTPHASMGMIGLVIVGGDTSNIDAIAKAKVRGKSKKKLKKLLGEL